MPTSSSTIMIWDIGVIRRKRSGSCGFRLRQDDAYRRAFGGMALDRDRTAVLVDDLLYDCKPQAGSPRLGRHVRLENARHQFFRKAIAVVGDRESHLVGVKLRAHLNRRLPSSRARLRERIL